MDGCCSFSSPASDNDIALSVCSQLPTELWLSIFQYLPKPTVLFTIRNVCKFFRLLSLDPDLWQDVNMSAMKEQTTTKFLEFDDDFEVHGDDAIDALTETLIADGQLTNTKMFCPLFDCVSPAVLKLKFSRYYDDFVLGENEKTTLYSFVNLQYLDVSFCEYITSPVLKEICGHCCKLEVLILDSCKEINDDGIKPLEGLRNLKTLNISHCASITDEGFSCMAQMPSKLRHFISDGVLHVSDCGIALFVSEQNMLETLILDGEELSDASVKVVACNLPHLKNFQISFCNHLTDESFKGLFGKARLHRLCFKKLESEKISNDMLTNFFLHECVENLKQLTLADCLCIEDSTVIAIATSCPQLEELTLQWCPEVTDTAIEKMIMSCRNLRQMNLVGVKMLKGNWLKSLDLRLPKLKFLDLSFCNLICDDDVYDLVKRKPDLVAYTYFHEKVDYTSVNDVCLNIVGDIDTVPSASECAGSHGAEVDF